MFILITDGRADFPNNAVVQANILKFMGVNIKCILVTNSDNLNMDKGYLNMQNIVTNPNEVDVLRVRSYKGLDEKVEQLMSTLCQNSLPKGDVTTKF